MSFSFSSLVRLIAVSGVLLTMLAVGIARLDPPGPDGRLARPASTSSVSDYLLGVDSNGSSWLDADLGTLSGLKVVKGDLFEAASCSPWVDGQGLRQAVGRWSSRAARGPSSVTDQFGLARYRYPTGELIDHVSTGIVPTSPPCWLPGTSARVLYPSGDGRLYRLDFEGGAPSLADEAEGRAIAPSRVDWRCPKPGMGEVYVSEVVWPTSPRLQGCLVASIRVQEADASGAPCFSNTRLHWLKLDETASAIVAQGPMIRHDVSGDRAGELDERSPVAAALPDGSAALAYLRQRHGEPGWHVCVARVEASDDPTRPVEVTESRVEVVDDLGYPATPAFSADGRWLSFLVGQVGNGYPAVRRASTAGGPAGPVAARPSIPPRG